MAKRRKTSKNNRRPAPPHGSGVADRREEFERLSRQSGSDPAGLRSFIEGKMAMVRGDPNLTAAEKREALAELQPKLEQLPR